MKKILILMVCVLSYCKVNANDKFSPMIKEHEVKLRNGRTVTCLSHIRGGISCDW